MATPGFTGYGMSDQLVQKVELRISCKNLPKSGIMSNSDPCAVLYSKTGDEFKEVARTEIITNDLNPIFSTPLCLDYNFESVQYVQIRVYDITDSSNPLKDDDILGQIETTLGQIVSKSPFTNTLEKKGEVIPNAEITIRAEEIKEETELAILTLKAKNLDNKDFLGKSDPFFELSKIQPDGSLYVVYRSEVIMDDLNPEWLPFEVRVSSLCGGDKTQPIQVTLFDWDKDGSHDLIGSVSTTLEEMTKAMDSEVSWPCINEKSYKDSGTVVLTSCKILKEYSFLDYIFGGLQIGMTIGVDFTGSNMNPSEKSSLHHIDPEHPNDYMKAISSVGSVLQDYDTDKLIPAYGFGAKLPPNYRPVLYDFPINFDLNNPNCAGIQGVLDAYMVCVQSVRFSHPTYVAPIIDHVVRFAYKAQLEEAAKGANSYHILLLLTDGILSDIDDIRNALVTASGLPMSLVIVGIGKADFEIMKQLDGDDGVIKSTSGEPVLRDIVQFVKFREFEKSSADDLARYVMAKIPTQVTSYFRMRGLLPKSQTHAPPASM